MSRKKCVSGPFLDCCCCCCISHLSRSRRSSIGPPHRQATHRPRRSCCRSVIHSLTSGAVESRKQKASFHRAQPPQRGEWDTSTSHALEGSISVLHGHRPSPVIVMRTITAVLAIVVLAIAPVLGNTEILNIPSHPLCSAPSSAAHQEALEISHDWPVLLQGATPNFFAIKPHNAAKTSAAQGQQGHWFRLALPEQGGVLQKGWTIRASWPANVSGRSK